MPAPVVAAATAPWWAPGVIAGGIAGAQGLISSAFNANQASKNRRFQERMSNSAHQRQVRDLRGAGINPILSSKLGGASAPPGAQAQATSPDVASSAMQAMLNQAQIRDINSASKLKDAQTEAIQQKLPGETQVLSEQVKDLVQSQNLKKSQQSQIIKQVQLYEAQIKNLNQQTATEAVRLAKEKALQKLYRGVGEVIDYTEPGARSILQRIMKGAKGMFRDLTEGIKEPIFRIEPNSGRSSN